MKGVKIGSFFFAGLPRVIRLMDHVTVGSSSLDVTMRAKKKSKSRHGTE